MPPPLCFRPCFPGGVRNEAAALQAREALQNDFKDSRPPFRVALKPNTMGYVGSINIGAYKDTEDWLAQLRNFPEDPNKPRFQVPLRGEGGDNIVSALHDKGVASQERQFPFPSSVLAKYGIFDGGIQDDEHVSHSTGATMAGLRVMSPETVQMVCDTAEDSAHSATQYASASLHKRRGEPDAKSAGAGVAVGTATYGSSVPADDEASRCKTQYDAEAEALGQFDSAVNRARILTSSSVAAGTEPAGTPKSKRLFASASVGVDTDQWANPEADAVAAALAVAQVQSKETDELEEEAALTAAATKCAAMKALGLVAEFDYTDHLAADGASRAGLRASRADFGATTNYANQLPEAPVPMEGVEPIRAQTQAPHMKNPDNKKTGLVGAFSARTRGSVAEAEYIVDLPNKGEGELTSRVIKPRDMREVTYEVRTLANGDNYKGPYLRGFKAGEGVYTFSNGDVYAGEFLDDAMEGYGVYVFANNGRYEGQWNEALYQGVGMETFARGSTYHGEYSKVRSPGPNRAACIPSPALGTAPSSCGRDLSGADCHPRC